MTQSITYLPYQVRMRVACYCTPKFAMWTTSPTGRGMVCSACRRPSPMAVLRVCVWCSEQFILALEDKNWKPVNFVHKDGTVHESEFSCTTCIPNQ